MVLLDFIFDVFLQVCSSSPLPFPSCTYLHKGDTRIDLLCFIYSDSFLVDFALIITPVFLSGTVSSHFLQLLISFRHDTFTSKCSIEHSTHI